MQVLNVKNKYKAFQDLRMLTLPFNMYHVIYSTNSYVNNNQIRAILSEIARDEPGYRKILQSYETQKKHKFLSDVLNYINGIN